MTTTHAFAAELEALALKLRNHPDSEMHCRPFMFISGYEMKKDEFRLMARIFAPLTKEADKTEFRLIRQSDALALQLGIYRERVCRKIQEEKWECDPVFSADEEAELLQEKGA